MGDFNVVFFAEESKGGNPPKEVSTNEFDNWVNSNNFPSLPFTNSFYTWTNGRLGVHGVDRKLDKTFANFDCLHLCKACNYYILPGRNYDHHPILLSMSNDAAIARPSSFRFLFIRGCNMMVCYLWLNHHVGWMSHVGVSK